MSRKGFAAGLALLICLLAGCGETSNGGNNDSSPKTNDDAIANKPVTLTIFDSSLGEDEFQRIVADPVFQKFPQMTLNRIVPTKDISIDSLIADGNVPDILMAWNGNIDTYEGLDLLQDITPSLKKHNVDLAAFEETAIEALTSAETHALYGLPYFRQLSSLNYNKDIFDKFGVPYPKDGMTWEETVELAKKVTRNEQGMQYKGYDYDSMNRLALPLSIPYYDSKSEKAIVEFDKWKKIFELAKSFESIPGNEKKTQWCGSFNEGIAAMCGTVTNLTAFSQITKFNWDLAQFPSYSDMPNVGSVVDEHAMFPTKTSSHLDEAIALMQVVVSKENQLNMAKTVGRASALKDTEIRQAIGQNIEGLQGKHLESLFKSKPAPTPPSSKYDSAIRGYIQGNFDQVMAGTMDINTALKMAQEQADQYIAAVKNGQK